MTRGIRLLRIQNFIQQQQNTIRNTNSAFLVYWLFICSNFSHGRFRALSFWILSDSTYLGGVFDSVALL